MQNISFDTFKHTHKETYRTEKCFGIPSKSQGKVSFRNKSRNDLLNISSEMIPVVVIVVFVFWVRVWLG